MKICYLSKNYKEVLSAGNKAKTDIEKIMEEMGFCNIGIKQDISPNRLKGFLITLASVLRMAVSKRKGDLVVLQYPFKKYFILVCNLAHLHGYKVVTVIHDLGSFRRKKLTEQKEIQRLSHSDYIIAHNVSMKRWLEEKGCKTPIGCLEIFDYLSETKAAVKQIPEKPYTVLYAGALSFRKNKFLYEIGETIKNYHLNLYGNGFDLEKTVARNNIIYKGFVPSDKLIATSNGNFGLLWDGISTDTCEGEYGLYLKYNNPHKTSLYIRCHLPVIIWRQAALATFVQEHNIGICIDSLKKLNEALDEITPKQYGEMRKNVEALSDKLANGYFLKKAIGEAEKFLSDKPKEFLLS